MKKIVILIGMGLLSCIAMFAQQDTTLNRMVIVENEYNPTIMDASKINVMPKMEDPKVTKKNINYATSLRPVSAWDYQVMAPVVREWDSDSAYRGYLKAGYGNIGNVDLKAGYLWDVTTNDRLNVAASLDGWNGTLHASDELEWDSRLYTTDVNLDYKHSFKKMDLMLGGGMRSQVFNYMGQSDRQHQTLGNAYLGLQSSDKEIPIQYATEIGFNYLKMKYPVSSLEEGNENNLYVKGNVWKPLEASRMAGLNFKLDNYSYSSSKMEGATSVELNPYYTIHGEAWKLHLGAHVDWWSGEDNDLDVSPDVQAEYVFSNSYVVYAKAGGGRIVRSFRELTSITPYWLTNALSATYVSLDAAMGLKASPVNGLWIDLSGGYQIRKNDYASVIMHPENSSSFFTGFEQGKSKVFYGGAELKYEYKDWFGFGVKGIYYNWEWNNARELATNAPLWLLPELEVKVEAEAKVMDGLKVNAGYDYVKRCEGVYKPIADLHIGATYAIWENLHLFANINNLLDKEYARPDAYPAQGFKFLAGLSLQF